VRFANSAHFSACRRKNFTEAMAWDSSNSRLLHCTIYYFAMQRKLRGGSTSFGTPLAATRLRVPQGHEAGNVPKV
jgi:hypothetical protein